MAKVGLSPAGLLQCSGRGWTVTDRCDPAAFTPPEFKRPQNPQNRPPAPADLLGMLLCEFTGLQPWCFMSTHAPHLNPEG